MAALHLVVHFPPYDTRLDEFAPGKHAGSPALRAWVEREQPAYLFCGHIHETAGLADQLGATHASMSAKKATHSKFSVRRAANISAGAATDKALRLHGRSLLMVCGINHELAAVAGAFAFGAHSGGAAEFQ